MVETELKERTVQRGLEDLKASGLILDTGDKIIRGRNYFPIYLLNLDSGPQNTRERRKADRQVLE
jgi:hypothetical protein